MFGFSAQMIESRLGKKHHLVKVYYLLDWDRFGQVLSGLYDRKTGKQRKTGTVCV